MTKRELWDLLDSIETKLIEACDYMDELKDENKELYEEHDIEEAHDQAQDAQDSINSLVWHLFNGEIPQNDE